MSRVDTVTTDQHDEPPARASPIHCPRARRRASQRWSALVTAPSSRIARIMRPVLDEACWAAFVARANAHYRAAFLAAFNGPLLRCVGRVSGAPCPRDATVNFAAPDAANWLAHLHLDHEQDLQITCDMWKAALPPSPAARGMTASTALSCATCSSACATTRSTARRWYASGAARLGSGAGYCTPPRCVLSSLHPSRPLTPHSPSSGHQLNMPHYRRLRDVAA